MSNKWIQLEHLIYNAVMHLLTMGQWLFSSFHPKLKARLEGLRLQRNDQSTKSVTIVFHCASLGEFEQIVPIIQTFNANHPNAHVIVSFFSASGYNYAKVHYESLDIRYLPIDTNRSMRLFFSSINPSMVCLVKYEIWVNMIEVLYTSNVPVMLIGGRFYPRQRYFRWYGALFRRALSRLDVITVSDRRSAEWLQKIGIKAEVVGDSRADRVFQRMKNNRYMSEKNRMWSDDKPVLVLGSIWPEDWSVISPILSMIKRHFHLIIAPHEPNPSLLDMISKDVHSSVRYSETGIAQLADNKDLIVDTIGHLADLYAHGDVAYVGGAFGSGVHNIFEPAAYALPVVIGPPDHRYPELDGFMRSGGVVSIRNSEELKAVLLKLSDDENRSSASQLQYQYLASLTGSSDRICAVIDSQWRN